jgi:hypothetical protein
MSSVPVRGSSAWRGGVRAAFGGGACGGSAYLLLIASNAATPMITAPMIVTW